MAKLLGISFLFFLLLVSTCYAADVGDLARQTQNPVSNLISVPFQYNITPRASYKYRPSHTLLVQPVVPIGLSEEWNIVTRSIFPLVSVPGFLTGSDRKTGVGDMSITSLLSPAHISNSIFWGVGSIVQLPTSSSSKLGSGKWGFGPSAVIGYFSKKIVAGLLASNTWTVGGSDYTEQENRFYGQAFFNYNFNKGWYVVSSPTITANWRASGQKFVIPVGGGLGKVFKIGSLPVNIQAQAFYNAIAPEEVGDFSARLQIQFLFPD